MKKIKENIKLIIEFILGLVIAVVISTYAATQLASSSVYYDNTKSGGSSNTVSGAIDELYELAKTTEFKIGDYVSMTPEKTSFTVPKTLTGYTADQTINPSGLNLWRVIRINSDNTVDMVSEYVSTSAVSFKGQTGYQNLIGTLNYIAKQYENKKYTSGSRHMGYNGQREYITNTSALTATTAPQTSSTSSSNVTIATEAKGLGDMGYETDYNLVNAALGTLVANEVGTTKWANYWLASREYKYNSSINWVFVDRTINLFGSVSVNGMFFYYNGNLNTYSTIIGESVRPILTLKSGVKAFSGDGSSESPYILE